MLVNKIIIPDDVQAIIYDCDGTLARNMEAFDYAANKTFEHFKVDISKDYLLSMHGYGAAQVLEDLKTKGICDLDVDEFYKIRQGYLLDLIVKAPPVEAAIELVKRFDGRQAVASNGITSVVNLMLDTLEIKDYFEAILCGDQQIARKPQPDLFLAAAQSLNVDPELCFVVEDSEPGFEAARRAGMRYLDIRKFY